MSTTTELITTVITAINTTTAPTTDAPPTGTGTLNVSLVIGSLSAASVSCFACLLALLIFFVHIQRPMPTVIRNSLNYMWAFVVFAGLLGSVETLVGRSMWYTQGSHYANNFSFCVFGASVNAGLRLLTALSLLAYYANMYVVRKYDEPFAMKCVKWYFLVIFVCTAGIVVFAALTAPDSYEQHDNRCILIVDSVHGSTPLVIPLVLELAIVVVGVLSAFALLCSRSKINSSASRRRVWVHVFFMCFLFASRLSMTVATIVYGVRERGNVTTVMAAPLAVRAFLLIDLSFTWALGFIVSAIFIYTECLYVVLRMWCVAGCGSEFDDEGKDFEPFLSGNSNPSFYSEHHSAAPAQSGAGGGEGDEDSARFNPNSDAATAVSGSVGGNNNGGGARPVIGAGAGLGYHSAASAVSLEEHLQGYTLSYTIRSSSNFADGEIPS